MVCAGNKQGGVGANGAGAFEQRQQAESLQNGKAVAADEFAADAMARVMAGFENRGRNAALTQADAERQARRARRRRS